MNRFPLTVASGEAFCNREKERTELARHLLVGNHCWIQATRRHGKTSLIMQTLQDITQPQDRQVHVARVDLLMAPDSEAAGRQILKAVGTLAAAIPGKIESAWQHLTGLFHRLKPEVKLSAAGPTMTLGLACGADEIEEALMRLDDLAVEHDVRVVLVLDEFQRLGEVDGSFSLEAGIRHAAEQVKATTLVFSGSNRHLMEQAFNHKGRPLYRHCRNIRLELIDAAAYRQHLQTAARERWNCALDQADIDAMMAVTERHPYYVNSLCNYLWQRETPPSLEAIQDTWSTVVMETRQGHEGELLRLTANQRRMLTALAQEPTSQPTSKAFVKRSGIASGSIENTLTPLIEHDWIARNSDGVLFVVDPAIAEIARQLQ